MTKILKHAKLGPIKGFTIGALTQYRSLPYAIIQQRFARAKILDKLPKTQAEDAWDATVIGLSSIQPRKAAQMDVESNQLPADILEGYTQRRGEDCCRATITVPTSELASNAKLPVVLFFHGGAFFLNSGERPYYSPVDFVKSAAELGQPIVFVSINYRLGALGFFHSKDASELVPPNNGLHDQLTGIEWVRQNIAGFGGDPDNMTAIGQSAGAESVTLHHNLETPLYKRSISLSGTPVTMPAKTPDEHEANFREQAEKLDIQTKGRSSTDIARDMIKAPIDKIQNLNFVGAPCTQTELLPYDRPTMGRLRNRNQPKATWLESQIVSASGYDGSISYGIIQKDRIRTKHSKHFIKIANKVLKHPQPLLDLYNISHDQEDDEALERICLFESDIGFFCAAEAVATGSKARKTHLQLFDVGNPFEGFLEKHKYATHSWDIVALLGAYDDRLSEKDMRVIKKWRKTIIGYCATGGIEWPTWEEGKGVLVDRDDVSILDRDDFVGKRRLRLMGLAREEDTERGTDLLWEGVCRRFLDKKKSPTFYRRKSRRRLSDTEQHG